MPLLSRTTRKSNPRLASTVEAPLTRVNKGVEARLSDIVLTALPEGALWVEHARALIVADLHFEKGSAFAKAGQMLPPYDTRATLDRLALLVEQRRPDIVVSLGDAFHDGGGPARMAENEAERLKDLVARVDWVWVEGNHDGKSAATLGGAAREELRLGGLVLRHEPTGEAGEISGHLHPCAKVAGRGQSVRRRCFAFDGARMVMPAFGAYTGGLNICDEAFAAIFPDGATALVLGRDRIIPAPPSRLLAD